MALSVPAQVVEQLLKLSPLTGFRGPEGLPERNPLDQAVSDVKEVATGTAEIPGGTLMLGGLVQGAVEGVGRKIFTDDEEPFGTAFDNTLMHVGGQAIENAQEFMGTGEADTPRKQLLRVGGNFLPVPGGIFGRLPGLLETGATAAKTLSNATKNLLEVTTPLLFSASPTRFLANFGVGATIDQTIRTLLGQDTAVTATSEFVNGLVSETRDAVIADANAGTTEQVDRNGLIRTAFKDDGMQIVEQALQLNTEEIAGIFDAAGIAHNLASPLSPEEQEEGFDQRDWIERNKKFVYPLAAIAGLASGGLVYKLMMRGGPTPGEAPVGQTPRSGAEEDELVNMATKVAGTFDSTAPIRKIVEQLATPADKKGLLASQYNISGIGDTRAAKAFVEDGVFPDGLLDSQGRPFATRDIRSPEELEALGLPKDKITTYSELRRVYQQLPQEEQLQASQLALFRKELSFRARQVRQLSIQRIGAEIKAGKITKSNGTVLIKNFLRASDKQLLRLENDPRISRTTRQGTTETRVKRGLRPPITENVPAEERSLLNKILGRAQTRNREGAPIETTDLQRLIEVAEANPNARYLADQIASNNKQVLDYLVAKGDISTGFARQLSRDFPRFVPFRNIEQGSESVGQSIKNFFYTTADDVTIDNDLVGFKEIKATPNPIDPFTSSREWALDVIASNRRMGLIRDTMQAMRDAARVEGDVPSAFAKRVFTDMQPTRSTRKAWAGDVRKKIGERSIIRYRDITQQGGFRYTKINDPWIYESLNQHPVLSRGVWNTMRRLYQDVTTGAFVPGFSTVASLFEITFGPIIRRPGQAGGFFDHQMLKATGGKFGIPGDVLGAFITAGVGSFRYLQDGGARLIHQTLVNAVSREAHIVKMLGGEMAVNQLAYRMQKAYLDGQLAMMVNRGAMNTGLMSDSALQNIVEAVTRSKKGDNVPVVTATLRGAKLIVEAVHNGYRLGVFMQNMKRFEKGVPNPTPRQVVDATTKMAADAAESTGNFTKGAIGIGKAGGFVKTVTGAMPYSNIAFQATNRLFSAAKTREGKMALALGIFNGVVVPAIVEKIILMNSSEETKDYYLNKMPFGRKPISFYIPNPLTPPEEGFHIDIAPEMAPFKGMTDVMLDHIFGFDALLNPVDPTLRRSQTLLGLTDAVARAVGLATPPPIAMVFGAIGKRIEFGVDPFSSHWLPMDVRDVRTETHMDSGTRDGDNVAHAYAEAAVNAVFGTVSRTAFAMADAWNKGERAVEQDPGAEDGPFSYAFGELQYQVTKPARPLVNTLFPDFISQSTDSAQSRLNVRKGRGVDFLLKNLQNIEENRAGTRSLTTLRPAGKEGPTQPLVDSEEIIAVGNIMRANSSFINNARQRVNEARNTVRAIRGSAQSRKAILEQQNEAVNELQSAQTDLLLLYRFVESAVEDSLGRRVDLADFVP